MLKRGEVLIKTKFPGTVMVSDSEMECDHANCLAMPVYRDMTGNKWCKTHTPKGWRKPQYLIDYKQGELF